MVGVVRDGEAEACVVGFGGIHGVCTKKEQGVISAMVIHIPYARDLTAMSKATSLVHISTPVATSLLPTHGTSRTHPYTPSHQHLH